MDTSIFLFVQYLLFLSLLQASASRNDNVRAYFTSLSVGPGCAIAVREIRPISRPPPHPWHPVPAQLPSRLQDLDVTAPPQMSSTTPSRALDSRYLVVAHVSNEDRRLMHHFVDPRYIRLHGDGHEQVEGAPSKPDEDHLLPEAAEHLWLPAETKRIDVYCQNTSAVWSFAVPHVDALPMHGRRFAKLDVHEEDDSIEVRNIQIAGPPSSQINVVFVSGGFTQQEKETFFKNASDLSALLYDPAMVPHEEVVESESIANMHKSVPYNRYWSFFNVYAVFQASPDSGASRPAIGLRVRNNLGCEHPASMERAPFCDRDLAYALADVSPAEVTSNPKKAVVISIINTNVYGGTGMYIPNILHFANFFNGFDLNDEFQRTRMLSLVDHELGHAFGNLADEYDLGLTEPRDRPFSNCQIGSNSGPPASPRWQEWIDLKRAQGSAPAFLAAFGGGISPPESMPWGILEQPAPICSFQNYFRPAAHCMMSRLTEFFMCPVCRDHSTRVVLRSGFSYGWPRFPLEDPITLVPVEQPPQGTHPHPFLYINSTLILHLPSVLSGPHFDVTWEDFDGSAIPPDTKRECPVCVAITPSHFERYPLNEVVEVKARIRDSTVFLAPSAAASEELQGQLDQVAVFRIRVSDDIANRSGVTLIAGELRNVIGEHEYDRQMIYTECPSASNSSNPVICSLNFTNKAYAPPPELEDLSQYDDWVFVVMGGVGLFFLILWLFAANKYGKQSDGVVRPIFETEFSCVASIIRGIMMFSAVVMMLGALAAMGAATYYYTQFSAIGRYFIIAGVVLACGLYFLAFIGFWAVSSRSKRMLLLNALMLLLALGTLVAAGVVVNQVGEQITDDDSKWTRYLRNWWESLVADSPERACGIQRWLRCTGFITACTTVVGSSLQCPRRCDQINYRFATPCREVLQALIHDNYDEIVTGVGVCGGLLVGALVLNMSLFCILIGMKRSIRERIEKRVAHGNGSHAPHRPGAQRPPPDKHRALRLLQSLDASDSRRLMREFQRIDIDGNGELDKRELFIFFKKALCYKPTLAEIDEIFKIADLDGDGTISMKEFLLLFNCNDDGNSANAMDVPLKPMENQRIMRERLAAAGIQNTRTARGAPVPTGGVTVQRGPAPSHPNAMRRRQEMEDLL